MNILFITADQWQGDCLSLLGHPCVATPNLDALAAEETAFTRHYAQAVPCSPARASLYSGLYLMNHRVCVNGTPHDERHTNVALEAKRAGYDPYLFGYTDQAVDPRKVASNDSRLRIYEGVLPGFTQRVVMDTPSHAWQAWLRRQAVEGTGDINELYRTDTAAPGGLKVSEHLTQRRFGTEQTETRYVTDGVLDFLETRAGTGWFAHVSYSGPHPPFSVPEPHASMIAPSTRRHRRGAPVSMKNKRSIRCWLTRMN
jgi:arylsulfatase A-like enzyme